MKLERIVTFRCALLLLLLGASLPANAVSLLLPAIQAAREAPRDPPSASINPLNPFDALHIGDLPMLSLGFLSAGFETTGVGQQAEVPTEMVSLDLRSALPVLFEGDPFDLIARLVPPDPIVAGLTTFTTTGISPDGSSASGELKGAYHFIVEVALIDPGDPNRVSSFLHDGSLELFALWHSEGRQLVIDSPIEVSGLLNGRLGAVPLPAGFYLFLSGLLAIGAAARQRLTTR